jgi:TrmH family RNA methyltransferase
MVVVLDGIQDPGNAGAIIRVAEAFGATGAIFGRGSAHPHHPKLLRAAAGSMFRLPYAAGVETSLVSAAFRQRRMILFTAQPSGGTTLPEADLKAKFALVVGSEGKGISDEWSSGSQPLRIPTTSVESLNAAVAAGIILYEASRQRMLA